MKKYYLLGLAYVVVSTELLAQANAVVQLNGREVLSVPEVVRPGVGRRAGSVITIFVSPDIAEENLVGAQSAPGQPGYSSPKFAWNFNTNYTFPPDTLSYKYAIVGFDSIHDADAGIGYDYDDILSINVDTVYFIIGHTNITGLQDTFVMKVVALTGNGYPTNTVLWSDTLFTSVSLSQGDWLSPYVLVAAPGLTVTPPNKFGLRLEYYGPDEDTAAFVAGFYDNGTCPSGNTRSASQSLFYPNSYYFLNGRTNPTPLNSQLWPAQNGDHLITDCNGNGEYDEDSNEEWFIQNISFVALITAELSYFVGKDDIQDLQNVHVYPNPARDIVHISTSALTASDQNYTITITNIEGAVVHDETGSTAKLGGGHDINVSHLSDGIYFLRVNDGHSVAAKPFVIAR